MKRERILAIIVVAVVALVAAAAGFYFLQNPSAWESTLMQLDLAEPTDGGLMASGFIEAEEIDVAPQLGGRVAALYVEEGDDVEAGKLLAQIDGKLLAAQIASARAAVEIAEAKLAQVEAGARPEQLRQAEAGLAQAIAARDGAHQAWQDAQAIRDNPQDLDAQIAGARSAVAAAEAELAEATALKDAAVIAHDNYWDAKETFSDVIEELREQYKHLPKSQRPDLPDEIPAQLSFHMIPYQYWKAWVGVNAAKAKLDGAKSSLFTLLQIRDNPQEISAQIDAAETAFRRAEAAVQQAEAQVAAIRSGATQEEIAVAEAQVDQAQAALDKLLTEQQKLTIVAPVGGLVLERTIHEGELAAPGAPMITLGDLDHVTLTVYVPEDQLGKVNMGQEVEVEVDSFPDEIFRGTVVAIASEAEFTPRNVQTEEERVNMVFAVDVSIPNPDHKLKPGVPADATIITEER
ncbi:MAG: efflux RND transporter periplasmic adaptor subunit [Anaerolineae bacterium]|jgi:multidrug resistance efflux pump